MISIVIPTFNRASLIPRAIRSVLLQDETDWELLIVDNASSDNTARVVEEFLSDPRIKYFYLEQKGAPLARNFGLRKAQGKWIIFLDSDDELRPYYFSDFKKTENDSYGAYYGNYTLISNGREKLIVPLDRIDRSNFVHGNPVGGFSSVIFLRDLVLQVGGHDQTLPARQDADLYYRLMKISSFKKINFVICNTYIDSTDRISDNSKKRFLGWLLFYKKHAANLSIREKYLISKKLFKHSIKNKSINGLVNLFMLFFK